MALSKDTVRVMEAGIPQHLNELTVSGTVFEGSAIGQNPSDTSVFRAFVDGDNFIGMAQRGAASGEAAVIIQNGVLCDLSVAGTVSDDSVGATVYLTDDGTFSLADSGTDTILGTVSRVVSSGATGVCRVRFSGDLV